MSHFVECQTEFRDPQSLVPALVECGFEAPQIEVHQQAVPLYGYKGDARPQKAHIVIRRQHIGQAANDVGWERQADGTYRGWISEYDRRHRFNDTMCNHVKQEYAYRVVYRQQRSMGRSVERRMLDNGELEVVIAGYR